MDAILFYTLSGLTYSRTIELLKPRGMDEPDHLEKIGVVHDLLDGSLPEQVLGFRKIIEATVRANTTPLDRRFLAIFIVAESKALVYGDYVSNVVHDEELVSQWLEDCELCREFTLELVDSHVYTAWSDGTIADTDMYYTAIVEITGTLASPQTFTTNVTPLATDIWGNSFPAFSGSVHKASVLAIAAAYSQFVYCQIGEVTVSGGNLTWQGFASDFGTPADDGKYYVKFTISVQTTT